VEAGVADGLPGGGHPDAGDFREYTIGDQSFLIVRGDGRGPSGPSPTPAGTGATRCGRAPAAAARSVAGTRLSWTLDGRLADIPDRHLTVGVVDDDYGLAEAAVGSGPASCSSTPTGGRPAPGRLPRPADRPADRLPPGADAATTDVTVRLACNWKVAIEAFLEVYHVQKIHPQLMPRVDDVNTAFELIGEHSRMIVPYGVPSMRLEDIDPVRTFRAFAESGSAALSAATAGAGSSPTGRRPTRRRSSRCRRSCSTRTAAWSAT